MQRAPTGGARLLAESIDPRILFSVFLDRDSQSEFLNETFCSTLEDRIKYFSSKTPVWTVVVRSTVRSINRSYLTILIVVVAWLVAANPSLLRLPCFPILFIVFFLPISIIIIFPVMRQNRRHLTEDASKHCNGHYRRKRPLHYFIHHIHLCWCVSYDELRVRLFRLFPSLLI